MKNILVTGSSGMLGQDLVRTFGANSNYDVYGLGRSFDPLLSRTKQIAIDLGEAFSIDAIPFRPDIIIHTAAITDLTLCERMPKLAEQVHINASATLAKLLKKGGRFFYISTDSVFDGARGNYFENDLPNPLNVYASTKLKGERAVAEINAGTTTIVRTNIYGIHTPLKNSLAEWAFDQWRSGKKITGFSDLIFNAVYTGQLSQCIKFMIDQDVEIPVVNIAGDKPISKYDFLDKFRKLLGFEQHLLSKGISDDFPSALERPKNSSLNTDLLSSFYKAPDLEQGFCDWIAHASTILKINLR